MHIGGASTTKNIDHESQERQKLVLVGSNVSSNQMQTNRAGKSDIEGGSNYGEYLRSSANNEGQGMRSKTPGLMTGTKMLHTQKSVVNQKDRRSGLNAGSKTSLVVSNDTLRAIGEKSAVPTSDGDDRK